MSELQALYLDEIQSIDLLANQVVEGFITGIHKSPFHGFSVEFAEHRLYNNGESTKHIDWKLFAKTNKMFVKRYEEETNLRCHIIIDNSGSMHYPLIKRPTLANLSKLAFSAIAAAALLEILKRQRDAVGLSIYSNTTEFYAPAKGNEAHRRLLLSQLEKLLTAKSRSTTETYTLLHDIADKIHKRSLIFLFTDMFQTNKDEEALFQALRHLKHHKHEVVLFHTFEGKHELEFDFDDTPKKFVDLETGEEVTMVSEKLKEQYKKATENYFNELKMKCMQYKIDYVPVDITQGYHQILFSYLVSRKRFL